MTQTELGRKLGITKAVVSSYETGLHQPKHELLVKLSRIFGVTVGYLYGLEDEITHSPGKTCIDISGLDKEDSEQIMMMVRLLRSKNSIISDARKIMGILPDSLKTEARQYLHQKAPEDDAAN